eukprot:TRINITY_DN232_c0_g1_i2.p2 TRINITY_DN232_c0_g1~~TRINITY_DN232_c0_g1_i2.p2  ORF type:complete len:117 (-),score=19.86 TRINITY_DN232_c0_g1_i2:100-450(-)
MGVDLLVCILDRADSEKLMQCKQAVSNSGLVNLFVKACSKMCVVFNEDLYDKLQSRIINAIVCRNVDDEVLEYLVMNKEKENALRTNLKVTRSSLSEAQTKFHILSSLKKKCPRNC